MSSKIRLQDVVGSNVGREMGAGPRKSVDADTAPGGLIIPEGREIDKIWYRSKVFA